MKIFCYQHFGDVTACHLGWSPVGRPLMTVNCYLAGGLLIDTGQPHMREAVLSMLAEHLVEGVLLTHHHEDHSGNAAAIRKRYGLPVMGHPLTAAKMRRPGRIFPYQHLIWGAAQPIPDIASLPDALENRDCRFVPIHTPGHSKDHTAYLETRHGWLFSGDLYLGDRIKYFRSDENIRDQIASLKHILSYDFDALFCAHRPRPEKGKRHLAHKLQYLEDFYGSVMRLAGQGMTPGEIMKALRFREQWLVKAVCFGNVSAKQMVKSVLAAGSAPHVNAP